MSTTQIGLYMWRERTRKTQRQPPKPRGQVTQLGPVRGWTRNRSCYSLSGFLSPSLCSASFSPYGVTSGLFHFHDLVSTLLSLTCHFMSSHNQNLKLMLIKSKNAGNRTGENIYTTYIWQNLEFFFLNLQNNNKTTIIKTGQIFEQALTKKDMWMTNEHMKRCSIVSVARKM